MALFSVVLRVEAFSQSPVWEKRAGWARGGIRTWCVRDATGSLSPRACSPDP